MSVTIQLRRGTAAQWTSANPVLALGEVGLETDTRLQKIGDGATAWASLPYPATATGLAAVLLAEPVVPGQQIKTITGIAAAGDGGGGTFTKVAKGSLVVDGGTIFASADPAYYWQRVFSGHYDIRWFGAVPGVDCSTIINNMLAVIPTHSVIYIPRGHWVINAAAINGLGKSYTLQGTGWKAIQLLYGDVNWGNTTDAYCSGSVIHVTGTHDGIANTTWLTDETQVEIRDLAIVGPGSGTTSGINYGTAASNTKLFTRNVLLANCKYGLNLRSTFYNEFHRQCLWGCDIGLKMSGYVADCDFFRLWIQGCNTAKSGGGNGVRFWGGIIQGTQTKIFDWPTKASISGVDGVTNGYTLTSAGADFVASGVEIGDAVVISAGGNAGTYYLTNVTQHVLTVDPAFPVGAGGQSWYTISGNVAGPETYASVYFENGAVTFVTAECSDVTGITLGPITFINCAAQFYGAVDCDLRAAATGANAIHAVYMWELINCDWSMVTLKLDYGVQGFHMSNVKLADLQASDAYSVAGQNVSANGSMQLASTFTANAIIPITPTGANVTLDAGSGGSFQQIDVNQVITMKTPTNAPLGMELVIDWKQDGTGHAVLFDANFINPPTVSVVAASHTVATFKYLGYTLGTPYWLCISKG